MSAAPDVVFAGTDGGALTALAAYEAVGGLTALRRARSMACSRRTASTGFNR